MQPSLIASPCTTQQRPPMLKGAPLLAHTFEMARDPLQLFVRGYQAIGPVFRVRAVNREFTVIAGPEAFEWVAGGGEVHLSAAETLGSAGVAIGAKRTLVTIEGDEHMHMRKSQRAAYSKSAFIKDAPAAFAHTAGRLSQLRDGVELDPFALFQRLIMEQLGQALIGEEANDYFADVRDFIATNLNVHVHGLWPAFMLRMPRYKRAEKRFIEMGESVLRKRRNGDAPPRGDLIDDALAYVSPDGRPLDDRELIMAATSPFIAGMDTAAAMASFMFYQVLRHPQVLNAICAEIDAHLDFERFSPDMLMRMPALHAAAMETLRLHTIALAQPRMAVRDFDLHGFTVRKGTYIMLSGSVSHFLPRFYPDPYTFDLDRYHAPRNEHRQKHAYAPYGIGAHLCLGSGIAELQFPLNVALMLKMFRVELTPPGYTLRQANNPTPHPVGFKVKLTRRG